MSSRGSAPDRGLYQGHQPQPRHRLSRTGGLSGEGRSRSTACPEPGGRGPGKAAARAAAAGRRAAWGGAPHLVSRCWWCLRCSRCYGWHRWTGHRT